MTSGANSQGGGLANGQVVGGGRYTLVRFLGKGGMGVVWLARDNRLEEEVALKFLAGEISHDTEALADMRRETLKSRRLSHPNIIRIHDLFEAPGEAPFISMEYIEGKALNAHKAEQPQMLFSWDYLRPLVQQLCSALDYAHGQKIIHRDLKPGNMMLTAEGILKLADFGIAATASDSMSRLTRNMGSSGTPAYMSPQQMSSQSPKVSDDIYALGATLYELLTSKPPFYRGDIYRQVKEEPPAPLDERLADLELQNDIPGDVSALIMACLAKEPAQRPPSAAAVADWIGLDIATKRRGVGLSAAVENATDNSEEKPGAAEQVELVQAHTGWGRKKLWMGFAVGGLTLLLAFIATAIISKNGRAKNPDTSEIPLASEPAAAAPKSVVQENSSLVPKPSDSGGWVSLFNGRDLTGWDGDPEIWSVQNGTIVGDTTGKVFTGFYSYLILKDQQFADFELKALVRMPDGNSGIQFRAQDVGNWQAKGYQQDIVPRDSVLLGCMTFDKNPSGIRPGSKGGSIANLGEKVVWDTGSQKRTTGSTGVSKEEVLATFDPEGWNEYTIIAQGDHFTLKINGMVTTELTENDPAYRTARGILALQAHRYKDRPMRVEFKNILVRRLDVPSPETASQPSKSAFMNSLGMKFVPLPGTDIQMCIHETRRKDYAAYAAETSDVDGTWKIPKANGTPLKQTDDHPAVMVSWTDASDFCSWLSKKEGKTYRLPTEHEWNLAVAHRLEDPQSISPPALEAHISEQTFWDSATPEETGNYRGNEDGYSGTAPVMSFKPNHLGIYDLGGNAWEWCHDWFDASKQQRVVRGCGFLNWGGYRKSAVREAADPDFRIPPQGEYKRAGGVGFRIVVDALSLAADAESQPTSIQAGTGWIGLLAGNSFTGWTPDKPAQWKIKNGVVTGTGPRSHLRSTQNFTNMALKVEAMAEQGANGGIFFRVSGTRAGNLQDGYEAQVENGGDRYPTGSLYNIRAATEKLVNETEWFEVHVVAIGSRIVIRVNDSVTVDYTDPARKYTEGRLALQSMLADASASYRNLRVKHLPEDEDAAWADAFRTDPGLRAQLGGR